LKKQEATPARRAIGPAAGLEIEKRAFLGVAAAVILLLLVPWRGADAGPSYRMLVVEEPPPLEVAPLPDLPPPPPVVASPLPPLPHVDLVPIPEPIEVPPEDYAELEAEVFVAPRDASRPRSSGPHPPPPRDSGPVREGMAGLDTPQLLEGPAPKYPRSARTIGCGGTVIIEAFIDTEGRVRRTELIQGVEGCPGLDEAAMKAVAKRRYRPGRLEGRL